MPRIIDSHIHMYPPEVFSDPREWARTHGEPGWSLAVAPEGRRSIQGWATVDQLLADMDDAGVEKCVMLGWYWERQDTCELQNGWYIDWTRMHPDRLLAFASVQPAEGQRAIDGLRRALDGGLCGIGEILPQAQGFSFESPEWHRVMEVAIEHDVPLNLHVSDPVLVSASVGPATPLASFVEVAREFPRAKLILAHWGGGLPFHELNPRVRRWLANVCYDTAASPLLYDPLIFRRVVDLVGVDRVLYGSDYPLLLHPGRSARPDFRPFLEEARAANLTDEERAGILGGNAARLLGLA